MIETLGQLFSTISLMNGDEMEHWFKELTHLRDNSVYARFDSVLQSVQPIQPQPTIQPAEAKPDQVKTVEAIPVDLSTLKVKELKQICRNSKLAGHSKHKTKDALVNFILSCYQPNKQQ